MSSGSQPSSVAEACHILVHQQHQAGGAQPTVSILQQQLGLTLFNALLSAGHIQLVTPETRVVVTATGQVQAEAYRPTAKTGTGTSGT